jgi:hypothetical protein
MSVRILDAAEALARVPALAEVLFDAVEGGASVNFMAGYSRGEAEALFRWVAEEVAAGRRALFEAVEDEARRRGRTLLTFDTVTGSAGERLYLACGCTKAGEIPDYALLPDGTPVPTSVFWKKIEK